MNETTSFPGTGKEHMMHHMDEKGKSNEAHRGEHEGHKMADFKRRFIISMILTVPVVVLSPFIQSLFGYRLVFPGSIFVLFLISTEDSDKPPKIEQNLTSVYISFIKTQSKKRVNRNPLHLFISMGLSILRWFFQRG